MDRSGYGDSYWCVMTTKDVSEDGIVMVYADTMEVHPSGTLQCWGHSRSDETIKFPVLCIPSGQWFAYYAANVWDGTPIAVDHWAGVTGDAEVTE